MPRLRDALKRKFKSPQAALRALGLDETLIEQEQNNMALLSRKAAVAKGALMAVLRPVLAADAQLNLNGALKHLTTRNFSEEKDAIAKAIFNVASRKLARDQTLALDEVEKAMDVAEKDDEPEAKDEEKMLKEGKNALDAIHMKKGMDAEGFKKMLKEKMSEDDYKAACDMMEPEESEDDEDESEEAREEKEKMREMKEKAREEKEAKARDAKMKNGKDEKGEEKVEKEEGEEKITKGAMDAALKNLRVTERGIRLALDQVRPLVGDLRADLAFDNATDVYRHAAAVLGVKGAKTMHAEALWPVIEAKAENRPVQRQNIEPLGFDEESISEAVKIAPGLARIRAV